MQAAKPDKALHYELRQRSTVHTCWVKLNNRTIRRVLFMRSTVFQFQIIFQGIFRRAQTAPRAHRLPDCPWCAHSIIDGQYIGWNKFKELMHNSRISLGPGTGLTKGVLQPPKSRISSLKAILKLDQGRVPLSQYMNRPTRNQHKTTYQPEPQVATTEMAAQNAIDEEPPTRGLSRNTFKQCTPRPTLPGQQQAAENHRLQASRNQIQKAQLGNTIRRSRPKSVYSQYSHIRTPGRQTTTLEQEAPRKENQVYIFKGGKQVKQELVNYRKYTQVVPSRLETPQTVQLQEVLGMGANATVRKAVHKHHPPLFAIKIYDKYKLIEPQKQKRVHHQIQLLNKVDHPNLISLHHCLQDKRQIHLLFEYIPQAQTLQDYLRVNHYCLPEAQKHSIAVSIARGLTYLHSLGIAHRDIKHENIIIGQERIVKIIDLGFATSLQQAEVPCGTPSYMAPQLLSKHKQKYEPAKVDVWALGVLLYYLHEGCHPFSGYNEKQLTKNITLGLYAFHKCQHPPTRTAIQGALRVDPQRRLSVDQILQTLLLE